MTRDDLVRFASRDWAAIEADKAEYWAARKRSMTPEESLAVAADLRRFVARLRPDWPSETERAADHQVHVQVSEALRAVAVTSR